MLPRKVKVASKNPIIIYEDYAEIVLLDRNGNKKAIYLGHFKELNEAKEVRAKAEKKYFREFRFKPIEVD